MIIYPAIDMRGGKVVRLKEGDPNRQTTFGDDPVAMAQRWIDEGAAWIHVVNLDGAFETANDNGAILEKIAKLNAKVQFGGGMRSMDALQGAIDRGASRVVIGTAAITQPEIVREALAKFGAEAVCVALDAKEGKVVTHGWQQSSDVTPVDFGRQIAAEGVIHALYTDVRRDGGLIGANVHDTIMLGRDTGLKVIASGGITSADEINMLARSQVVAGAVIGMALYEDKLTMIEALMAAKSPGDTE